MSGLVTAVGKLAEARRNARLTRAELETARLEKFRRLARHARDTSPYYAEIMTERGIDPATCTPADFPVLTKQLLMANFDRIVTDRRVTKQGISQFLTCSSNPNDLFLGKYRVMHTSGTSGEVGYFVYSPEDWIRGMLQGSMRRRRPARLRRRGLRRFRVAFYGATGGHFAGVTMASAAQKGVARLFAKVGVFEINEPLSRTIAELNAFQPDVLSGYTAALKVLAAKQREGSLRIRPAIVGATGETATKADLDFLAEAFGAQAGSAYGSTEHMMMGASNPDGETMTLADNDLIFELAEDHTLVTNLFNQTLPLIRYRMSDILKAVEPQDPALPNLVIRNLVGRSERVPTFTGKDGKSDFISPHTINEIFVAGITRFQMRLTGASSFRFLVCLDPGLDAGAKEVAVKAVQARLQEILGQKGLDDVAFNVEPVCDIPVDPKTRKFRLIVEE
jgi:phenylacetate-CoA ligase